MLLWTIGFSMKRHLNWLLPILFVALLAPFTPTIDLYVSNLFYNPHEGTFYNCAIMKILFRYGEIFGLLSGGVAAFFLLLSFTKTKFRKYRPGSLALVLTLVIGSGLITNTLLKGYWGRPRPKQVVEFGGKHTYRPFWHPKAQKRDDLQKSFPSGHVAMGFYFLSLCLVGRRYNKRALFQTALFLTIGLGGGLMITRVAQGGHFVSDVLISALLMWLVALSVDKLIFSKSQLSLPEVNSI